MGSIRRRGVLDKTALMCGRVVQIDRSIPYWPEPGESSAALGCDARFCTTRLQPEGLCQASRGLQPGGGCWRTTHAAGLKPSAGITKATYAACLHHICCINASI